jgi:lipid II:glycine glycyltransferase (peptidoglycan interpeptide bridge formation enzyme)
MKNNVRIIDSIEITKWNEKAVHPLQRWEWGEARKEMGIDVFRIGAYKKEELENVYQITFHNIPYTPLTIGYLPRSLFPTDQVLEVMKNEGKKRKAIFIKIEPVLESLINVIPVKTGIYTNKNSGSPIVVGDDNIFDLIGFNIIKSSHPLFTEWNQIIDITISEDDLLKNMKSKTRYNIRLAEKKGVKVQEMTNDEGFSIFSKLYFETCKRQGYRGHTEFYHKTIFKHFKKNISHILIAFYENKPLCAYHLFHHYDTMYYPYGGSSVEHKNVMAPNLLMWEAIKLGKKLGCKNFDMWGSLPPYHDKKNPWVGFTRFKEGYGTEFFHMPGSYDLVISPLLYKAYSLAHKIRQMVM